MLADKKLTLIRCVSYWVVWSHFRSFSNLSYPDRIHNLEIGSISVDSYPWLLCVIGQSLNIIRVAWVLDVSDRVPQRGKPVIRKFLLAARGPSHPLHIPWERRIYGLGECFLQFAFGNTAYIFWVLAFWSLIASHVLYTWSVHPNSPAPATSQKIPFDDTQTVLGQ